MVHPELRLVHSEFGVEFETAAPSLAQVLQIANGERINRKLAADDGRITRFVKKQADDRSALTELYLVTVRRRPNEDELRRCLEVIDRADSRRDAPEDVLWRRTDIFTSDISRGEAARQLEQLRERMDADDADDQDHLTFFATNDEPQSDILAYLDERRTTGPVEGLNNKARVITKRCYGVRNTNFVEPTLPRCESRRTRRHTDSRNR